MDDNSTARFDPIDPTRVKESARWCLHLKEPACVVGEHRQFCLPGLLEDEPQRRKLGEFWSWLCFLVGSRAEPREGLDLILAKLIESPRIRVEGFSLAMVLMENKE